MPAIKKQSKEKSYASAVVSSKVRSCVNDPYFVKKAAAAKETLRKVGLPRSKKK